MLFENDVSKTFWREAVNTIVYTLNRVQIRKGMNKTPYELQFSHSPSIKYFRIFGSRCYIKRDDGIGKFDPKSDEGMFLGYSLKIKAYRCFNYKSKTIVECANVRIDEKFGTKEKMVDYNPNEEENNYGFVIQNFEVLFQTKNDLKNDVSIKHREEQRSEPREEIDVNSYFQQKHDKESPSKEDDWEKG